MNALEKIDFGFGAAQHDTNLKHYFYKSVAFDLTCSDRIYLVLGAKGAGKSAIYQMLREWEDKIPIFKKPNLWLGEEPQLQQHWATLHPAVSSSKVGLWRFHIASLIAGLLINEDRLAETTRKTFERFLVRWGLVGIVPTPWQSLRTLKFKVGIGEYVTTEIPPKIPLAMTECDQVIHLASSWLDEQGADLWICLDSLDEVRLNGSKEDEIAELLSSLMTAVSDLIRLRRLKFKLFFRSDIYDELGYVNKDHFSALKLTLKWTKEDIGILLAHRLAVLHPEHNDDIIYPVAQKWLDEVFDWEEPYAGGFEVLYERFKDGNGDALPRDFVNFCIEAQKSQLTFNRQGVNKPTCLISAEAIRQAIDLTAADKLNDFLQVFPNYSQTYKQLSGHNSRTFNRKQLSAALGKADLDAKLVISDLVRIGAVAVKDRKAVNQSDSFEIPYLYALALKIGGAS
ncbi:MAG: hypothetical protein ABSA67_11790 [Candidatus Brocadiia bacterium]|jgi:hypothetical protein